MDPVEYYEKYFLIDGKPAPPLSKWEKDFLRNANKITEGNMFVFIRSRQYRRRFLDKVLKELKSLKGE